MAYARGDTGTPIVRVHYIDATPELVARTRENFERALSKLESERLGAVSENIAEAINPVKEASAPILICILRRYADQIGKVYPDAEEVAKEFQNVLGTAAFVIPMEGGKPNAGMDDGAPMDDADSDAGGAGRIG